MSKPSSGHKTGPKDMYWFAHGGIEANTDKNSPQRSNTPGGDVDEESSNDSLTYRPVSDHKGYPEEIRPVVLTREYNIPQLTLSLEHNSSPCSSLEREDRPRTGYSNSRKYAVEDRKKQLYEAEQERNDALMKKHIERDAAIEARRNAQRSNILFAFGSSIPRNLEPTPPNQSGDFEKLSRFPAITSGTSQKSDEGYDTYQAVEPHSISPLSSNGIYCLNGNTLVDGVAPRLTFAQSGSSFCERKSMSPPCWLVGSGAVIGDDIMTRSMTASMYAPRGRRKNDLTPTVPIERNERSAPPRSAASSFNRKRSVSMTRLDQLAQPRKHYVEANKANSTASSGASSMKKDMGRSPRPLSSASEKSGHVGSGEASAGVHRRARTSPKKPRPVTIAGTVPDQGKPLDGKVLPIKRSYTPSKRPSPTVNVKKAEAATNLRSTPPKSAEQPKTSSHSNNEKPASKHPPLRQSAPKKPAVKQAITPKAPLPKVPTTKKASSKKPELPIASAAVPEISLETPKPVISPARSPTPDSETNAELDKNNSKRIISEEEAKAALAEKRRLAREQAEKEAELERQRQENLRLEEERRLHEEEEEHRKMEVEQLRLLEEHRKQEDEKLKKAIEEQERKEEEEKVKKEEELRMKSEQEKKAKEEAERQRIELEEKLRKEEEERAERKKRLEKIMSRTRSKTSGKSPSGSISGSDQLDSGDNPQEIDSSGANSLDSDAAGELPSDALSLEDHHVMTEQASSVGDSLEANPTFEIESETESLNVNDKMPSSETASQENSMIILPDEAGPSVEVVAQPIEESASEIEALVEKAVVDEIDKNVTAGGGNSNLQGDPTEKQFRQELVTKSSGIEPAISRESCEASLATSEYFNKESSLPDPIIGESHSEMISDAEALQYEDGFVKPVETYSAENSNLISSSYSEQLEATEINVEQRSRDSTSSDLKLPDPIYEMTSSDEGSISSEKHQKDMSFDRNEFNNFVFNEGESAGFNSSQASGNDDVFHEQDFVQGDSGSAIESINPFATESSQSFNAAFFEGTIVQNPDDTNIGSLMQGEASLNQHFGGDEKFETSSPLTNVEGGVLSYEATDEKNADSLYGKADLINPFSQTEEQGNYNVSDNTDLAAAAAAFDNPFHAGENQNFEDSTLIPVKNIASTFEASTTDSVLDGAQLQCAVDINRYSSGEAKFPDNNVTLSNTSEFDNFSLHASEDYNTSQQNVSLPGAVNENQTLVSKFSNSNTVGEITIITDKDTDDCIGIISSVDQAQIVPKDFSKESFSNEHFNNIYENVGATDSEDSSLDSNLSQIIDVNNSEKETNEGLNCIKTANGSDDHAPEYEASEQQYSSQVPPVHNGDLISKSNGKLLMSDEAVTNGHRNQSSEHAANLIEQFPNYTQLDKVKGNDISSVDHSKDNIFENVDAIDFSNKVAPDPFLGKGNSNPVSGNPFLM